MAKLILKCVLVLFISTSLVIASENKIKLLCKITDGIEYSTIFTIDLEKRIISGFFTVDAYITSVSDDTIIAWIKGDRYSDGIDRVTSFDRYSGKLTTGMMKPQKPTFQSWICEKAPKKVF